MTCSLSIVRSFLDPRIHHLTLGKEIPSGIGGVGTQIPAQRSKVRLVLQSSYFLLTGSPQTDIPEEIHDLPNPHVCIPEMGIRLGA